VGLVVVAVHPLQEESEDGRMHVTLFTRASRYGRQVVVER